MAGVYRQNVAAIVCSPSFPEIKEVFIGKRHDMDAWQFPQGGIDAGEGVKEALYRELREEIGTDDIDIIEEYPNWVQYDFRDRVYERLPGIVGQRQKYFLVKLKSLDDINIQTLDPEFVDYRFVSTDEVLNQIVDFKKDVYKEVIDYFKQKGFL